MKTRAIAFRLLALICFLLSAPLLRAAAPTLDIYWIDVEGGGGTLLITPAKESILIDTGWPWGPSAARIRDAATNAGVSRIDYLVVTHFHIDHFGGAAALSRLIPIGTVLDNGIPDHDPDGGPADRFLKSIEPYRQFKAESREQIQPGATLPLKQAGGAAPLSFTFMGARKHFFHPPAAGGTNPVCGDATQRPLDTTDNANSAVSLVQFGPFKFYDGGDLTWNMEGEMVCPVNSIGQVDVCQVDHHGVDLSSNPVLLRSLAPVVTVMNNGPRKGGAKATLATLRSLPSLQTMYQVHRDLRGGPEFNTDDQYIANLEEKCAGNYIKCSVDASGRGYTISIPATGYSRTYQTRTQ
ncbi:MAG: MBL fold metallo-hydrolase [Verrucomicrobiota bacterium]|jgi:beta-lactamase superfamily II metal-dependent hydrolase